jgi:hypothetical protein
VKRTVRLNRRRRRLLSLDHFVIGTAAVREKKGDRVIDALPGSWVESAARWGVEYVEAFTPPGAADPFVAKKNAPIATFPL